jgi:hypothetical protein
LHTFYFVKEVLLSSTSSRIYPDTDFSFEHIFETAQETLSKSLKTIKIDGIKDVKSLDKEVLDSNNLLVLIDARSTGENMGKLYD